MDVSDFWASEPREKTEKTAQTFAIIVGRRLFLMRSDYELQNVAFRSKK